MRFVVFSLLLVVCVVAKPIEEKSKPVKLDELKPSNVSPTTEPPLIPTEVVPHENHPDGEPTFEEEIVRVIEGSVENLIPFGASEKPSVVKKESANEEPETKNQENDNGLSVIDWFGMVFNHELTSSTTEVPQPTTEAPMQNAKLDYLQMMLNQQRQMTQQNQQQPMEEIKPVESPFAARYQQWQDARQIATHWFNSDLQQQKQDQYSSSVKSKLNWDKLLAEPVEDYKQYIPVDNTVQWSSNEVIPNEMIDNTQKQLIIPSNFMKNKEQWFGESDI